MWQKLKSFLTTDSVFYAVLLLLIGVVSFGLGRMSLTAEKTKFKATNSITQLQSLPAASQAVAVRQMVVASRSGSKYHLPDCPGAKQMKNENKLEFSSTEAAEAAGYTPAANCPGLE